LTGRLAAVTPLLLLHKTTWLYAEPTMHELCMTTVSRHSTDPVDFPARHSFISLKSTMTKCTAVTIEIRLVKYRNSHIETKVQ